MPNATAGAPSVRVSRARDARGVTRATLFKADHPRAIDLHIDYFGSPRTEGAADPCGEAFLDSLMDRTPA